MSLLCLRLPSNQPHSFSRLCARDYVWLVAVVILVAIAYTPLVNKVGIYNVDSGIYLAGARGLAEGQGYCYSFHLGIPRIGFYPPLQSAWLALWWILGGDFPQNIPWLNAGMFVIGIAVLAFAFVFWRRWGLPNELAATLVLAWAFCPAWIGFLLALLSDPGFTAACLLMALIWTHPRPLPPTWGWAFTGLLFAVAYGWRTAALAPMVALGAIAALQIRRRMWLPVFGYGLPVLGAILIWKLLSQQTTGYGEVLRNMIGGWRGYFHLLWENLFYCLKGIPFWELTAPTVARIPAWLHFGPPLKSLYEYGTGSVFWLLAILAIRGFRRQTTRFDWAVLGAGVAYVAQFSVMPVPATHFFRFFCVLFPIFALWIWRGWVPASHVWLTRGLLALLAGTLLSNAALSAVVFRRDHDQRLVAEFNELARWTRANLAADAQVALDATLPIAHWFAHTRRSIVVDYFDAYAQSITPITHAAQGFPRADYLVMQRPDIDRRVDVFPRLFTEIFRTSRGNYRLLKVDPDMELRFRKERRIPEPRPNRR